MSKLIIKHARKNDVPLILSFINQLAEYEKLSQEVVATEALLEEFLFGDKTYAEVVIGYLDAKPVGLALFFHNFSTFSGRPGIYLEDLFVLPESRGQRVGEKLLAYLASLAKERNCARLEWSVLDWNEPAISFYKRMGAVPMNEWTTFRVTGQALDKLAKSAEMHLAS
jgi:GNAT superfamily N-acetyltransferase